MYARETSQSKHFLQQSFLYFSGQEGVSDHQNLSTDKATKWAIVVRSKGQELLSSYGYFIELFQRVSES